MARKKKTGARKAAGKKAARKTAGKKAASGKGATSEAAKRKKKAAKAPASAARKAAAGRAATRPAAARNGRKPVAKRAAGSLLQSSRSTAEKIDRAFARLRDWRGERLAQIRALVHEVDPGVVEEWKWMGTPVWSHDGMYALANPHKEKVKLTFLHGAHLSDPKKLFNAGLTGNTWRAIDFGKGDRIDRPALAALLRAAIAYNAKHAVPRSRGSRV